MAAKHRSRPRRSVAYRCNAARQAASLPRAQSGTMPEFTYDLDPVNRITAHAVGQPGQRVFYIQARRDRQIVSLIAEKEQVRALAQAINQLLEDLTEKNPLLSSGDDIMLVSDMTLEEPLESSFRIAQMGLGYD